MDPEDRRELRAELARLDARVDWILQANLANPEARAANQELLADAQERIRDIRAQLAASAAAPATPWSRFRALLASREGAAEPEARVLRVIKRNGWLAGLISIAETAEDAGEVYNMAASVPQTTTRAASAVAGYTLDGQILVPGTQTASFFRALDREFKWHAVKIPQQGQKVDAECALFGDIGGEALTAGIALVPVQKLPLTGDPTAADYANRVNRVGIVMPLFVNTLDDMPDIVDPAFLDRVITSIGGAIEFLYRNGWCHGDVKPSNIFQSYDGARPFLGDYGSAIRHSEARTFTGGTPAYQCEDFSVITAGWTAEQLWLFDRIGLAISVLDKCELTALAAPAEHGGPFRFTIATLRATIALVRDSTLRAKLSALISD